MINIVLVTHNPKKKVELDALLNSSGIEFLTLKDVSYTKEINEPFHTLEENAIHKAKTVFEATGYPCIADDSGLFVDALNGEPGVFSARYAGEPSNDLNNIQKLLSEMKNKPNKEAYFQTVVAFVDKDCEKIFVGEIRGKIIEVPRGTSGFGYDPVFVPDNHNDTFAELDSNYKNSISHRYKAVSQLVKFFNQRFNR